MSLSLELVLFFHVKPFNRAILIFKSKRLWLSGPFISLSPVHLFLKVFLLLFEIWNKFGYFWLERALGISVRIST